MEDDFFKNSTFRNKFYLYQAMFITKIEPPLTETFFFRNSNYLIPIPWSCSLEKI